MTDDEVSVRNLTLEASTDLVMSARDKVTLVLDGLLPAGPDDERPPPDWPHWQLAHKLMDAKLQLTSALGDLAER